MREAAAEAPGAHREVVRPRAQKAGSSSIRAAAGHAAAGPAIRAARPEARARRPSPRLSPRRRELARRARRALHWAGPRSGRAHTDGGGSRRPPVLAQHVGAHAATAGPGRRRSRRAARDRVRRRPGAAVSVPGRRRVPAVRRRDPARARRRARVRARERESGHRAVPGGTRRRGPGPDPGAVR